MHTTRHLLLVGLSLSLLLPGCKPTVPAQASGSEAASTASASAAASPAPTCPDADFQSFLKRFEASVDVQRASTAQVVTMDSVDGNAQPEPAPVTKQVPRADITFPVLPDPERRKAEGLEETLTELGPVEWEVKHAVPDSDAQVRFKFQATPCWTLVRISDDTI